MAFFIIYLSSECNASNDIQQRDSKFGVQLSTHLTTNSFNYENMCCILVRIRKLQGSSTTMQNSNSSFHPTLATGCRSLYICPATKPQPIFVIFKETPSQWKYRVPNKVHYIFTFEVRSKIAIGKEINFSHISYCLYGNFSSPAKEFYNPIKFCIFKC